MAGKIKGITIEIDGNTGPLEKALGDVNKKTRDLQGELKSVERLLKLDPGNTELIAQKQKLLGEQVENSRKKLMGLKQAQDQVNAAFKRGDLNEEQYRHFSRQVINAEQDLDKFEGQLKQVNAQAKRTGKSIGELGKDIKSVGEKAAMGITLPVVGGAVALTEGTRELRQDLGKLEAQFVTNGFTAQQAQDVYKEFYGILGEDDTAIEAVNHLAELTTTQQELADWTTIATGVYAKFGDSLPIEGLTEAANETAKVGKVTGPLADALNWVGISEDELNGSLEKCTTEQERQALVTKTLTGAYTGIAKKYREVNKNVIEANKANADLKGELADLGEKIEPIMTKVIKFISGLIDKFNNLPEPIQNTILMIVGVAAVLGPLLMIVGQTMIFLALFGDKFGFVTKAAGLLRGILPLLGTAVGALATPLGIAVAAVVGLILILKRLWETSPAFRNWIREIGDGFANYLKSKINGFIDDINTLIAMANKLPKVNISPIDKLVQSSGTSGMADFRKLDRGYAVGTNFHPGGLAWVGERGPELLNLPRGSQVFSNQQSMAMANQNLTLGGTIRVEGVNNMAQVVGVAQIVAAEIERGDRRLAGRVRVMPSMA